MVRIGMGHDDAGEAPQVGKAVAGEHGHDGIVIDAVPGVDHHDITGGMEDEQASAAGGLETVQGDLRRDQKFLDIGIKMFTIGIVHGPAGCEHGIKDLAGIAPAVGQFLRHVVGIAQEREQERFLGVPDQLADCLCIPDIEDRIVKMLAGRVVLEDIKAVPGLQLVQKLVNLRVLLKAEADREPVRVPALVVKIDIRDICPGRGCILEEFEQGARAVGEKDGEFQEIQRL